MSVGLIGLGRMGLGLAANLLRNDIAVEAWDASAAARAKAPAATPGIALAADIPALARALAPPRCVIVMIPAGPGVDECIGALADALDEGDVIIDAGNSHYADTERRQDDLQRRGLHLLGLGVSGGPGGARSGPSLMAGGPEAAWRRAEAMLSTIAAAGADGKRGIAYFGAGGAGHFVKMVHNGIEYAVLQILADVFDVLSSGCGLAPDAIAEIFAGLNTGITGGYLMEASARIVAAPDGDGGGRFLIDALDDGAAHNRTGRWAVEAAAEFGVAVPTIAAALDFRLLSADGGLDRKDADPPARPALSLDDVAPLLGAAVAAAMTSAFAQGLRLIEAAGLDAARAARVWCLGSVLGGELVERFAGEPATAPVFKEGPKALRGLCLAALSAARPVPGLVTALGYVDALQGGPLSTRFIQLHRDHFGGHGFRRRGDARLRHGPWHADDDG